MDPAQPDHLRQERFVVALSSAQSALYRHIFALLPYPDQVDDVLQETNIVLWRKAAEFDESRDFMPWAKTIARYQVLAAIRDNSRDRLVLDERLIDLLSDEADLNPIPPRLHALEVCLSKLGGRKRDLILSRYRQGSSVEEIANSHQRPVGSISQALYRIRQTLIKCVDLQSAK
ncbi:sigma-70 family RNA polymerase sigma factor [Verrucomicrobiaceae bacterium 227]